MSISIFDLITSDRKREEIRNILDSEHPAHFQKVFLVGFLRYGLGLTSEDVTSFILARARWHKLDKRTTAYMVESVKKRGKGESAFLAKCKSSRSERLFSSPVLGTWQPVYNGAGFILEWVREK
jgi:hypothetical protein